MAIQGEQEFSTEVDASVADCFATITDFDAYPQWSTAVERIAVLERHADGLARLVEFHVDMKLRTVRYVLQYDYERPGHLEWHSVEGDVESIHGTYDFEKRAPKRSRATCRQAVSVGFWIPGPLRSFAERQALKQSVLEFKEEAERRAQAKATRRRRSAAPGGAR